MPRSMLVRSAGYFRRERCSCFECEKKDSASSLSTTKVLNQDNFHDGLRLLSFVTTVSGSDLWMGPPFDDSTPTGIGRQSHSSSAYDTHADTSSCTWDESNRSSPSPSCSDLSQRSGSPDESKNPNLDSADLWTRVRSFCENNRALLLDGEEALGGGWKSRLVVCLENRQDVPVDIRRDVLEWYDARVGSSERVQDSESYTCSKCGKIFAYKNYLERHIKYVCPDSSGRTWKCSFCFKAFQYPCYLKRHMRSHTGESPFKCTLCDKAFVRSTDLQRHIRNHTGERPYRCSSCSRAFARSTDLKRHMRTHTGEKPYKCCQCGKTFSQSGSLQTHRLTHMRVQEVPLVSRQGSHE